MSVDPVSIAIIFAALAFGGVLKGAIGAGAPLVATPVVAILYDVPTAVALFVIPNLLSNMWQAVTYRAGMLPWAFTAQFAGFGALGAVAGTMMLAGFPDAALKAMVAVAVYLYVGFRVMRPDAVLPYRTAVRVVAPAATLAGVLQGAAGLSAPVSLTFLNAMRLKREQFVPTVAAFFVGMALVQGPTLAWFGIFTVERFGLSCLALLPILAFMPVGAWLARHISREAFEQLVGVMLLVLATNLMWDAFT